MTAYSFVLDRCQDGTCTAEFDAPTSLKGRRYYSKITVADGNTRNAYTVIST